MGTVAAFGPRPGEDPYVWVERLKAYYLAEGIDSPPMWLAICHFHEWATWDLHDEEHHRLSREQMRQAAEAALARALAQA